MSATSPRITTRINSDTQIMLSKAAAISGIASINSFVLNAAIEKAKKIIADDNILHLNQQDAEMLIEALDGPAQVHQRLKQASKVYSKQTQNSI